MIYLSRGRHRNREYDKKLWILEKVGEEGSIGLRGMKQENEDRRF